MIIRYAQEFGQTENVNILTQFISELERRSSVNRKINDPNYPPNVYGDNDEDLSLPPLGPAFNGNEQCLYDDPEAIQYALPMVNERVDNVDNSNNHNYAVIKI